MNEDKKDVEVETPSAGDEFSREPKRPSKPPPGGPVKPTSPGGSPGPTIGGDGKPNIDC